MVNIFLTFLIKLEIYGQGRLQKLTINQLDFFAIRVIYFWNKLPNQIKNSNSVKILRLNWSISEIMIKKKLRGHLGETIR